MELVELDLEVARNRGQNLGVATGSGDLEGLADHYVHIGQKSGCDKATLVKEMRRRLQPIYDFTDVLGNKVKKVKKKKKNGTTPQAAGKTD